MSLTSYKKKRNFSTTKEPEGSIAKEHKFRFVVQLHDASRLHYDFRLELGGVLKSWAVPKGPSLNPADKRLAVMVEDHPVSYISFQGTIPKGNYGAGTVNIWDKGSFVPVSKTHKPITEKQALACISKGELKFLLKGKKLKGEFVLVRLKDDDKNWLLVKHRDEYAVNTGYNAETDNIKSTKTTASIQQVKAKHISNPIKPMLAFPAKVPFDDKDWIFEIKWDGYRAIAELQNGTLRFYSRNGIDFSERFTTIVKELKKIKHEVILDGEVVLLNEKNLPDFQKLQHYENYLNYPLIYYVFDILMLNGKSTTTLPLTDRRKLLKKLLPKLNSVRYCDHIEETGIVFYNTAKEKTLEGIMAKRKDSTYAKGTRSKLWLKIKNIQSTEVVIAGYTAPRKGRKNFGALVLATKKGKGWQYRGHVGTGFNEAMLRQLKELMQPLETTDSPFKIEVPVNERVTWVKPKLVADIAYTEITNDGIFRHPAFLRLRDEKNIKNINEESKAAIDPPAKNEIIKAGKYEIQISNYRKIFWPEEGYTKGDVAHYYERIAKYMLPHLKNRPLSLKRNPNGIRDEGFYHKDAGENAPDYVTVFPVESESSKKTIDYIICNNLATLLYLANLGCIEINPWNSTMQKPDNPTWMVIDIDPSPKNKFTEVVDVALAVKEIMDKAKMQCYCKTSGATGLHVYTPLKNKYSYDQVRDFGHIIANMVNEVLPRFTSIERTLSKRSNKIYIDFLQNRSGQTLASAYSLRPVKGACVSTPLEWKEVTHKLLPSQFTIDNMIKRVEKKGDLFSGVITGTNDMLKALKLLKV